MQPLSKMVSKRLRSLAIAATLIVGLALTGCAGTVAAPMVSPVSGQVNDLDLLDEHGLSGLDATQIIERLDAMPVAERPTNLLASVRPDVLVLSDGLNRESQLPLPDDLVYISVAPFQSQTHDCYFHSLTTCLGELADAEIQVLLTDKASGEVLVDESRQTFNNGFIGFWVPRGVEADLTVGHDGQSGTVTISTMNSDDPTCITTLQIS